MWYHVEILAGIEIPARRSIHFSTGGSGISSESEEESMDTSRRGMVLPFQPLSISFDNISYFVDTPAVSQFYERVV